MSFANEAGWDRIVRIVLGAVLLYLGWSGTIGGGLGVFFQVVGFVPLATGLLGRCPLYAIFGFSTARKAPRDPISAV